MKQLFTDVKKWLGLGVVVLLIYLVIRYWPNVEHYVSIGWSAATPIVTGLIMAYVINLLMNFYENLYAKLFKDTSVRRGKRIVCLIFAFLSLLAIIALIVNLVLPELIRCITSFVDMIPGIVEKVVAFIGEEKIEDWFPALQDFDVNSLVAQLEQMLASVLNRLGGAVNSVVSAVTSVVSFIVSCVIGLIVSVYVLLDKERLVGQAKVLIHTYIPKKADRILYVLHVFNESFQSFIGGQCLEAMILGALCTIGMYLFRFPYALMVGVFVGFTALVPVVGAYIGAAVGAVMMLTESWVLALQFLIFIVVLQQLEGNLIYPKVVGKSIGLPGLWVLCAITVGGGIGGVGGMLLAVPIAAAGYRLLHEDVKSRGGNLEIEIYPKKEKKKPKWPFGKKKGLPDGSDEEHHEENREG